MFNLKKILLKNNKLESQPREKGEFDRVYVAACVILFEVAKSDYEFSSVEKKTIESILKRKFALPPAAVEELMEMASRERRESTDLYEFTRLINKNYSTGEKKKIVEEVWRVIYADEKLDRYEDHFVHRLAKLLRLRHDDLIEAKLKVKYENKLG